jgi:hypothetical protein
MPRSISSASRTSITCFPERARSRPRTGSEKNAAYELVRDGKLVVRCVGKRRRVILHDDAERCMAALPQVELRRKIQP